MLAGALRDVSSVPGSASTRDVSSVPGSASTEEEYKGSRKLKQRFEYSENSTAGFVELAPDRIPSEEEFMNALLSAPDVERVEWKETQTSQGNVGKHHMEQNLNVWVPGFARPIEFELTRDPHMKETAGRPFTVSACFKAPPIKLHGDAWRILLHAVKGRELLPTHVQEYAKRALARAGSIPLDKDDVPPPKKSRTEEPGSASSEPPGSASSVAQRSQALPAPRHGWVAHLAHFGWGRRCAVYERVQLCREQIEVVRADRLPSRHG